MPSHTLKEKGYFEWSEIVKELSFEIYDIVAIRLAKKQLLTLKEMSIRPT